MADYSEVVRRIKNSTTIVWEKDSAITYKGSLSANGVAAQVVLSLTDAAQRIYTIYVFVNGTQLISGATNQQDFQNLQGDIEELFSTLAVAETNQREELVSNLLNIL